MINWGVIGLGIIANEFGEAIMRSDKAKLHAVASRSEEKANDFAKKYGAQKAYTAYEDLYNDPEVDIIYVATVNSQHLKNIKDALNAGKHVLCEKAILGKTSELNECIELAKSQNLILAEAMTIYHMPLYKRIKEMIHDGVIGNVKTVKCDLGSLKEADDNNRFFSKELGGGAMLDIGTYTLSFIRYFIDGDFNEQKHLCTKYPTGVDEMWSISLKNEEGTLGSTNLTFRAKLPKRAIIAGEDGYFEIDDYPRADKATLVFPDGKREVIEAGNTKDALLYEIDDLSDTINHLADETYLSLTQDVVRIMDDLLTQENLG